MISWIQRYFQQHFRVVFFVLLAVIIISFIFTIGAFPGIGRAGPKTYAQKFFGYNLSQQSTGSQIFGDAALSAQLEAGITIDDNAQLQQYALQRLAALALADRLKIPNPSQAELAAYIQSLHTFAGSDGQFDPSRYAAFRDNLKTNPSLSEGDITRVLEDDIRVKKLQHLLDGPGYVLPAEVRDQLTRTDSSWTLAVATVDYNAFKPEIAVSDDALKRYFDDNSFRYEVAPRVAVDYVKFLAADYSKNVTVTAAEVRTYYDENPARFPQPEEKKAAGNEKPVSLKPAKPANPEADFAAVRPQVEQALKAERAKHLAAKAAADLTVALYDQKLQPHTPAFDQYLAQNKLQLQHTEPFNSDMAVPEPDWTPQVVAQAVKLDADHPVSDALPAEDGSVVLFWRESLPAYRPELSQVRDRVAADYRENERRKRFAQLGRTIRGELEAHLKAGETLAKAAAGIQPTLEVKTYPPFTRRQPPKDTEPAVLGALERLHQGQISDMMIVQDKGYFVYVQEKKLPDLTSANPQYAVTRAQLARLNVNLDENLLMNEIIMRELRKNSPLDR